MDDTLLVTRDGPVMEIAFNRPDKKNALTRDMYAGVVTAFQAADADPAIRAIIVTGTGDIFTSGNDIKDFQRRAAGNEERNGSPFLAALAGLRKPLIGAVNGVAIGIGTTMLAHCDLVVAARSARFVMPFTSLGLVPEAGSSLLFPRMVGMQRANALLLLGDSIDAATAAEWGFVYQVVDDAALMDTARAVARRVAALPPNAVRLTKQLIRQGSQDLGARIDEELVVLKDRVRSPEAGEAFAAFVEKRRPDFSKFE
jgi:enoyl-CoA hydratase/carnithine racemase